MVFQSQDIRQQRRGIPQRWAPEGVSPEMVPADGLESFQAVVKGGVTQAEPRGVLSGGDEPAAQGGRAVPACRRETQDENRTERTPA